MIPMVVVGLSHRSAPIEIRERLALPSEAVQETLRRLAARPSVGEALLLSTCNRVEIYAAPRAPEADLALLERSVVDLLADVGGQEIRAYLRRAAGREAARHLFRVAASLDSLVVGEPQILGQVKEARRQAERAGTLGPELGAAVRRAVGVAKRVRSETAIGAGQVSVPTVAVDLARQIFGELAGRCALLVGAGKMAETAAKQLRAAGALLLVVNRSPERAAQLAQAVGGEQRDFSELDRCLTRADVVVSSTASPAPIITKQRLRAVSKARRGRSLFLVDIAVPRDVEPAVNELDNVYLYDIDDLSVAVAGAQRGREAEAERAEEIVQVEVEAYVRRRAELGMKPVIVSLRERTRQVLHAELERSMRGKLQHLAGADREALATMIEAALNKLLHAPSTRLKELADKPEGTEYALALCELFDLRDEQGARPSVPPSVPPPPAGPAEPNGRDGARARPGPGGTPASTGASAGPGAVER
ncbi:MAG: glutamyl-tRNA reductase [Deltaproteobacteria bacterium]|nr:glutamyl-tRNA reductase [Deltaproteobacteria bacterium]